MKVNLLAVIVSNKKGDTYQVALSEEEESIVKNVILQLHDGTIKAIRKKLSLNILKNKESGE